MLCRYLSSACKLSRLWTSAHRPWWPVTLDRQAFPPPFQNHGTGSPLLVVLANIAQSYSISITYARVYNKPNTPAHWLLQAIRFCFTLPKLLHTGEGHCKKSSGNSTRYNSHSSTSINASRPSAQPTSNTHSQGLRSLCTISAQSPLKTSAWATRLRKCVNTCESPYPPSDHTNRSPRGIAQRRLYQY